MEAPALHLLHLEDSPWDAEIIHEKLRSAGVAFDAVRVDNEAGFAAALAGQAFDLILCDYNLPGYNGIAALKLARERQPKTPVILISGSVGEDEAVLSLQLGATDYLLKQRLERLAPAVTRAIREAVQKREMQAHLERVQRLENLGMLAAGIAHDFNNILAPMVMAGPLLEPHVTEESGRRILAIVEKSAARGAALVRQLLSFARGAGGEAQPLQLRHVLKDVADLAQATFPKSIEVEARLHHELWTVRGNPTQLHQVFLNLCVNARDAMPEGGELRISAANREIDGPAAAAMEGGRTGAFVAVEIQDTGSGMPPEVIQRIWEPFFTTKGASGGTGLGLATVRGILQQHGGLITLRTGLGQGTTFTVLLPALSSSDGDVESAHADARQFRGNGEIILVVDDEDPVRELATRILTDHGYRVLAAHDGAEAISVFAVHANEVALLLTDLQMPLLSGPTLVTALLRHHPGLRVVAMSGGSDCPPEFIAQLAHPLVRKPFNVDALLGAVHAALHRPANHSVSPP